MDKKKLAHRGERSDNLALVKAAAWAWHQHGSEGKPIIREFDATRTRQTHRPSRYKLEAARMMETGVTKDDEVSSRGTISPDHADNSLLDRYEIACISQRLEYLMKSSSARSLESNEGGFYGSGFDLCLQKKQKKKVLKGFWLRHEVVCGTNEDVAVEALIGNRRRPKRFVPAISVPICIPRAAHAP